MAKENGGRSVTRRLSRADIRSATLHGYKVVRANPKRVTLTPGQRQHIIRSKSA